MFSVYKDVPGDYEPKPSDSPESTRKYTPHARVSSNIFGQNQDSNEKLDFRAATYPVPIRATDVAAASTRQEF